MSITRTRQRNHYRRTHPPHLQLKSFNLTTQQYGTYFAGFAWDVVGCLTFKSPTNLDAAEAKLKTHFSRVETALGEPHLAYVAVPEWRFSGCGQPGMQLHWHFAAAGPKQHRDRLLSRLRDLWDLYYGNAHTEFFNPEEAGTHYLFKTVDTPDFDFKMENLDWMTYTGPADLYAAQKLAGYVPSRIRSRIRGRVLELRDLSERPEAQHG